LTPAAAELVLPSTTGAASAAPSSAMEQDAKVA
jgi:hypothetical protein